MSEREVIFDMEADNLLDHITKFHCLSYRYVDTPDTVTTLTDYSDMKDFIVDGPCADSVLIGHSIIGYDLPAAKKILGVTTKCKIIDTLPLSWYLNHGRSVHGLDSYGEEFGVPKPKVTDWSEQPIEVYTHRCQEDTLINYHLWKQLKSKLQELYND
jgi:DNA polymerase III alpha subunit (gram-positive type)